VKNVVLVCGWQEDLPDNDGSDFVGIDRGALLLARASRQMVFAIGDFDSVTEAERSEITALASETLVLNPIKDISDTEAALIECLKRGYTRIELWGGLGGRFDHAWVNVLLLKRYQELRLVDRQNLVFTLEVGEHEVDRLNFTYLSIFALEPSVISLDHVAYPLDHKSLTPEMTLGLSNQILNQKARVSVHAGRILVICSSDA